MHCSYEEVLEDVSKTIEQLKAEARDSWKAWAIMAVVAVVALEIDDVIELLRSILFLTVLGFYFAYKWHAELNRRLLLAHRLQMTLVKWALPAELPVDTP